MLVGPYRRCSVAIYFLLHYMHCSEFASYPSARSQARNHAQKTLIINNLKTRHYKHSEESYEIDRSPPHLSCVHIARIRFFALAQNDKYFDKFYVILSFRIHRILYLGMTNRLVKIFRTPMRQAPKKGNNHN